jgi:hypothetical protein
MPFHLPRPSSVLATALAAVGIMLAVVSCSNITPLGPDPGYVSLPPARHLGSPITVEVMRGRPPTATGQCPVGWLEVFLPVSILPRVSTNAVPVTTGPAPTPGASTSTSVSSGTTPAPHAVYLVTPCYHRVGTPVTITSAAVSSVSAYPVAPGTQKGPAPYGFTVAVPAADVAAVTALIRQAYDSHGALGISVAGKLWEAPQVDAAFSGQQLKIAVFTRNQALRLYRLLIPSG